MGILSPVFGAKPMLNDARADRLESVLGSINAAGSPKHVMGRIGKPVEVARAIVFLASDDASFTTGAPLFDDGGYLAQ